MNRAETWAATLSIAVGTLAGAQTIREIRVEAPDGSLVDPGHVMAVIESRDGLPFDVNRVARDVRALERTGRYESVEARAEPSPDGSVAVAFAVSSRRIIERLDISGATEIGNRKVREWVNLGVGDMVDDAALSAASRRVRIEYAKENFPEARLTWAIEPGSTPGSARVAIAVKEGRRARIGAITVVGNEAVSTADLLRKTTQRRYRWYNPIHWFSSAGRMDDDQSRGDLHAMRSVYADRGYLDARVEGPEVHRICSRQVELRYTVTEGEPYRIGRVAIEGVSAFPTNDIERVAGLASGAIAAMADVDRAREAILDYYGNRGYILTQVRPLVETSDSPGVADIRLVVREGTPSKVRDIRIRGNVVTQDKVIRRELVIAPGEPHNRSRVQTSENRVRGLGYFSHVSLSPEPTDDPGWHDLSLEVREDRMGSAEAGVGFSSLDRLVGRVEMGHGNVDIGSWPPFGAGQKFRIGAEVGSRRQDYYASFVEPYLFDERLRLTADLFSRTANYYSLLYNVERLGGLVSVEAPLGPWYRVGVGYGLEQINLFDVDESASEKIQAEEGRRLKSSVEVSLTRDTRDRIRLTTRGNMTRLSSTVAGGPLGGETDWYKLELRSNQYFPLWFGHVFLLRGQVGVMEEHGDAENIPLFDRFFVGGLYTVRAFKFRYIGPTDERDEPIGGRSMAFGSAEYTVPIVGMVRAAAFFDAGMVWEDAYSFDSNFNSG